MHAWHLGLLEWAWSKYSCNGGQCRPDQWWSMSEDLKILMKPFFHSSYFIKLSKKVWRSGMLVGIEIWYSANMDVTMSSANSNALSIWSLAWINVVLTWVQCCPVWGGRLPGNDFLPRNCQRGKANYWENFYGALSHGACYLVEHELRS